MNAAIIATLLALIGYIFAGNTGAVCAAGGFAALVGLALTIVLISERRAAARRAAITKHIQNALTAVE